MKTWLFNIWMILVACLTIVSCTNDDAPIAQEESKVPVRLTLSFSDTPLTRDVDNKEETLDYTTTEQNYIANAYLLLVNGNNEIVEVVSELLVDQEDPDAIVLSGLISNYQEASKIVVLTNIKNQGIATNVASWLGGFTDINALYAEAIFSNTDINGWNISTRSIPMWGTTSMPTTVVNGNVNASVSLYRALGKVNIWINEKKGFEGFQIDSIRLRNSLDRGFCVSGKVPNASVNVQYANVGSDVPATAQVRNDIVYNCQAETKAYSDKIYLPEQLNDDASKAVCMDVYYTYNDQSKSKTLNFADYDWDIIRNHSYIFNISSVTQTTIDCKLYYVVENWEEVTINIPEFN